MQAADGSVEPLRDGVSSSLPAPPPDHVEADDSVDSTGFFLTAPRVDTASQGVEASSLVQQGQVAATPTNTPMAAAAAVLDGITGQPAASMDDAVAGDAEVSEGGAAVVSGDTAPAPCPDVAAQPQPQEQPQPQPDEEPVGSAIYVDDGDGRFVNASGEAKAYDGSQPVQQSSVPPLQPGRSVDSALGDEALAQGYFTPLSKDVSVGDDAGSAPQEEAGEPATPQAVTKGKPEPVARSPAVSPLPPEEGWATSPAGPGRPDRLRFDRSGLLVQPNRRLWTTGPVQLWTPEPKHDESNITFVDDETKMPSYIQAIQVRATARRVRHGLQCLTRPWWWWWWWWWCVCVFLAGAQGEAERSPGKSQRLEQGTKDRAALQVLTSPAQVRDPAACQGVEAPVRKSRHSRHRGGCSWPSCGRWRR